MSPITKKNANKELTARMKDACSIKQQETSSSGNNNDEDYVSEYPAESGEHDRCLSTGTGSSGGGSPDSSESAFSSASSECDEELERERNSLSPSSSSSSGRSSATQDQRQCAKTGRSNSTRDLDQTGGSTQLNTIVNLAPATQEVRHLVDQIRIRFLATLNEQDSAIEEEQFDELDLSEMRRELPESVEEQEQALAFRFITRFINFHHMDRLTTGDAQSEQAHDEIVVKLVEFLKFRKHYQLTNVLLDQFCKEIYHLHGIFPFGRDKNQLPIMYMRARVHRRWSHKLDEAFRRYVAWQVDLITKSQSNVKVNKTIGRNGIEKDGSFGICFDCLHVSYSCVDMDFLSYLVKILVNYYPTYCRYALCVDLPWLFRSVWKLVRSWLPEDARNTVQLITSKQLIEFIDADQIPNCIKINDLPASEKPASGRHQVPENFDSLQDISQLVISLDLSSSEVKQFKAHVEKVLKEYKQSGAI